MKQNILEIKIITIQRRTPIELQGIPGGNTFGVVLARTNQRLQQSGARARKFNCSLDDPLSLDKKKVCK